MPSPGGPESHCAGFCPGSVLIIPAVRVPGLAPCPPGNLHPLTSIVPWPFLVTGRQDWGPREVHSSPQISNTLPRHPEAEARLGEL